MQIRAKRQQELKQVFLDAIEYPIRSKTSSLQQYLLRNSIAHALQLKKYQWATTLLLRMDFLSSFQNSFGIQHISQYWFVVDPKENGDRYASHWQTIWQSKPTRRNTTQLQLLVKLFTSIGWFEKINAHINTSLSWLAPYAESFPSTIEQLKRDQAFLMMTHGNAQIGLQQFDSLLAKRKSRTSKILREIISLISTPKSPERDAKFKGFVDEVRSFPANTPNRFYIEKVALSFAFNTLEKQEEAIANLESIIPFQKGPPDTYQRAVDDLYFRMYLEYKEYAQAIPYGLRVLNNSTDMSRIDSLTLHCKLARCRLHVETNDQSLERYTHLRPLIEESDAPNVQDAWNTYVLELAQRLTTHYAKAKQWKPALEWRQQIVRIRRTKILESQQLSEQFSFTASPQPIHLLALALYQEGIIHAHLNDTSSAKEAWDEAIELYETIIDKNNKHFNKGLAGVLWKRHALENTPTNIEGLKRCLKLRRTLLKNGDKSQRYPLVHVYNVLGCWFLELEQWQDSIDHLTPCLPLLQSLIVAFPNKTIYLRGRRRVQIRLSWNHWNLQQYPKALELANSVQDDQVVTMENLEETIRQLLDSL